MEKAFLKISNDINRIRRADEADVEAVARIYSRIHDEEEAGRCSVGWRRGVYPTVRTAREAGRVACDFNGIGGVTLALFEKEIAPGADR